MADKRDYYEVLGVQRDASAKAIADAYRKLAMKYHPDRNPNDDEAVTNFKEGAEAFEVLNDTEKRARYDRFGHQGIDGVAGGAPHFRNVSDIFEAFGDVFGDSLFGDLFGGGRGRGRARRGSDLRVDVTIDLFEAARGTSRVLNIKRHQACTTCGGSGAKPGTQPETCHYCGGQGQVVQSTGIFSVQSACPSCKGSGSVIREGCSSCRGSGFVPKKVKREVTIPPGVDDQMQLRLAGEGEPSAERGPAGDCYCVIHVTEHALFQRDGQHLICRVPITYPQAALGATVEVPTLDGPETLDVPAGTQSGEVFKMRGRGMPHVRGRGRGDLLVQVNIEVPAKLAEREETLLRELAELEHAHVSPKRRSFFKKLKEYFVPHAEQEPTED